MLFEISRQSATGRERRILRYLEAVHQLQEWGMPIVRIPALHDGMHWTNPDGSCVTIDHSVDGTLHLR